MQQSGFRPAQKAYRRVRIAGHVVDPARCVVVGPEGERHAEPRVVELILALAARPGEVVSRDTLIAEVWGGAHGADQRLTAAISRLRRIFGDTRNDPRVVETVTKRGYRLIASVETFDAPAAATPSERSIRPRSRYWITAMIIGLAVASLTASIRFLGDFSVRSSAEATSGEVKRIVVLPLRSASGTREEMNFADDFSEELINRLGQLPSLKIVGRAASIGFKDSDTTLADIRSGLAVDYALEGNVRRADEQMRIVLRLVNADSGLSEWSKTYQWAMVGPPGAQEEIAANAAQELGIWLGTTKSASHAKVGKDRRH